MQFLTFAGAEIIFIFNSCIVTTNWKRNHVPLCLLGTSSKAGTSFAIRLIDYLRFYVPFKNFSLIWRRHHCRWRAAEFRPMLGVQGLWAGRDLYRARPAVTRDLGFSGLIRRTVPFSHLLRHTRGCGGSILTRILTGPFAIGSAAFVMRRSMCGTSWLQPEWIQLRGCA
jgi:hypothetical protein